MDVVNKKAGRKPKSISSNSGDETVSTTPVARTRGRPRTKPIVENPEIKKHVGRPMKAKVFSIPNAEL